MTTDKKHPKKKVNTILAVLVILVILYLVIKKPFQESMDPDSVDSNGVPKPSGSKSAPIPAWKKKYNALPSVGDDGMLKKGVKAKEVWTLQSLYNTEIATKTGRSKIGVDGVFGNETEKAVLYVLENKYKYTFLKNWRKYVKMSKAERASYFKTNSSSVDFVPPVYSFNPYPAESTFVANPYSFNP